MVLVVADQSAEKRLRAQTSAAAALAEGASLSDAASRVLAALSDGMGWELGAVWATDRGAQVLRCAAVWSAEGVDSSEFERITRATVFAVGSGIPGRAWAEGGPIWIDDVAGLARSERVRNTALLGLHAAFAFPIILAGGVLGVIELFSSEIRKPDQALVDQMTSVGSQLGQFIQRKEAEHAARQAEERFQALSANVQQELEYLAHHDRVTGLPNRTMFVEHLELALHRAQRSSNAAAVLFVDIDEFKLVNEGFGHAAGDALLQEIGRRLRRVTRTADVVARQSADEFLVLIADLDAGGDGANLRDAAQVAEAICGQIRYALQAPFAIGEHEVCIGVSTGHALFPTQAHESEQLIREARHSMTTARGHGRPGPAPDRAPAADRLSLTTRLRRAIERDEFVLHYQPLVELASGRVVGAEALIRWRDPQQGLVAPADFIPLAERIGMIGPISDWVVWRACAQAQEWRGDGLDLAVSVNLPPILWQPTMTTKLMAALQASGLDPRQLIVEITETAAMTDPDRTQRVLHDLASQGVQLAIDDFGTGYSSLSRLKQMPVATLKIDRSFIRDLPHDTHSATMVTAIVGLAQSLGLAPLAEGIETAEQHAFLVERACPLGQGFHFSRPVPAAELADVARARHQRPAA